MSDKILEGYLKGFADEYSLSGLDASAIFENFANYCVISKLYAGGIALETLAIDDGHQLGIDGMAIIVNDHLVTSEEEVDGITTFLGRLNAQFIFIQAKNSPKFDMGDMSKFFTAVEQFFHPKPFVKYSEKAENLRLVQQHIYDQSIKMEIPPSCDMYYVTTGDWKADANLAGQVDTVLARLKKTNSFSNVTFTPIDLEKLKGTYRALKNKIVREVDFERNIVLPKIEGIQESYVGILPCKQYLNLICDEDGNLQKNLFYDNVRDFQGANPVNTEIAESLRGDQKSRDRFVVMNNGITIVAKSIGKVGSTFKLIDFQIVNGCQTSHILHSNRTRIGDNMFLPVKLIVSTDTEVVNSVIKASNRQTVVNVEAFESLREFHKNLEAFYASYEPEHRLYYERRSKQYDNDPKIKKNQVISLPTQITSYISMFLMEPHSTHRYYGELLKVYREDKKQLFMDDHDLHPYYVSGYSLHLLDSLFASYKIPSMFKKFRYQLIMLFRLKITGVELPHPADKKRVRELCSKLEKVLWTEDLALEHFLAGAKLIDQALVSTKIGPHEATRRRSYTSELISLCTTGKSGESVPQSTKGRGVVQWFDKDKGFGLIRQTDGRDVFVHYSDIWGTGYRLLKENQVVEFNVVGTTKGLQAKDVETVDV